MRIAYDVQADALTLAFGEAEVEVSRELAPDLIVNLDRGGNVVALEILHATQRIGSRGLRQIAIDLQGL